MKILSGKGSELKITVLYIVMGLLWISLSTGLLYFMSVPLGLPEETVYWLEGIKGFFYVFITGLFLYFLINRNNRHLIQSKKQYENLFLGNPNPMWIFDPETYQIYKVNNAAIDLYGYSHEEFLQLTLLDIRPVEDHDSFKSNMVVANKKVTDQGIWRHKKKNGEIFFVNIYSHVIEYMGKKCRTAMAIDISDGVLARKEILKLNASLSEKEDLVAKQLQEKINFRNALNNSALVSITDLAGNIIDVNEKFCELAKYPKEELIGKNHRIINSGYHSKDFWRKMWQTVSSGESWTADVKNKAKDGTYYWVYTTINPIRNAEGNIYQYMSVRYDITQRKILEKKQDNLINDLIKYTYLTSHQLRAPLARMLGLVHLVHLEKDPKRILELVERLEGTSKEMDKVITEMNDTLNRNTYDSITDKSTKIDIDNLGMEVVKEEQDG